MDDKQKKKKKIVFPVIVCELEEFLKDERNSWLSDATFLVGSKTLPSYQPLLVSRSTFFEKLLKSVSRSQSSAYVRKVVIVVEGVCPEAMEMVLNFLHTDTIKFPQSLPVKDVEALSTLYGLQSLQQACQSLKASGLNQKSFHFSDGLVAHHMYVVGDDLADVATNEDTGELLAERVRQRRLQAALEGEICTEMARVAGRVQRREGRHSADVTPCADADGMWMVADMDLVGEGGNPTSSSNLTHPAARGQASNSMDELCINVAALQRLLADDVAAIHTPPLCDSPLPASSPVPMFCASAAFASPSHTFASPAHAFGFVGGQSPVFGTTPPTPMRSVSCSLPHLPYSRRGGAADPALPLAPALQGRRAVSSHFARIPDLLCRDPPKGRAPFDTLSDSISALLLKEKAADVFIEVCPPEAQLCKPNQQDSITIIPAHRLILCCRSGFFLKMFGGGWRETNKVQVRIYEKASTFKRMLTSIYRNRLVLGVKIVKPGPGGVAELEAIASVNTYLQRFVEVITMADYYQVPCVLNNCDSLIYDMVDYWNVCAIWNIFAEVETQLTASPGAEEDECDTFVNLLHQMSHKISKHCYKFVVSNFEVISQQPSFVDLQKPLLKKLFRSGELCCPTKILLDLLLGWARANYSTAHRSSMATSTQDAEGVIASVVQEFLPPNVLFNTEHKRFLLAGVNPGMFWLS
mmetsp:Transcript_53377/g.134031  ORF Transcript_53377/g.134031 Transcript_53377/m.134031 type:complete len:694 (+) Transcript_53377:136-2217(+)